MYAMTYAKEGFLKRFLEDTMLSKIASHKKTNTVLLHLYEAWSSHSHWNRKQSGGCQGLVGGRPGELFSTCGTLVLQDEEHSGDGLYDNVHVLSITDLYI